MQQQLNWYDKLLTFFFAAALLKDVYSNNSRQFDLYCAYAKNFSALFCIVILSNVEKFEG